MTSDVPATPGGHVPAPRTRIRRIGGWLAGLLVLAFLGAALIDGWSRVTSYDWRFDAWYLLLGVLGVTAALAAAAFAYALLVERLAGRRLPRWPLVSIWGRSLLGRYVPGSVLMFAGRVVLGREAGVPGRVSLAATVYEIVFCVGVSAIASAGFLLEVGDLGQGPWLWVVAVVPLTIVLLHPRVFAPASNALLRRLGRQPLEAFLSGPQVVLFAVLYSVVYGVLALAVWGSVRAFAGPDVGGAFYVAAGFLLSFVISMLAFVFPSGLGVREGIFALALARHLPGSVAIAAAAVARLVPTLVEIVFAGAIVALDRRRRRRSR